MKYLILLSLSFLNYNAQEEGCSKFKVGTFQFVDEKYIGYKIQRNDSIQYESNDKNGRMIKGTIEWIDECKYILTYISDNQGYKSIIGKKIIVEIISTTENSYTYKAQSGKESSINTLIKVR